jgi:outer membrane murein-binding lipoprotein Lpp
MAKAIIRGTYMYSKTDVVNKLREAASHIQSLTDEKEALAAENSELLEKIASLEANKANEVIDDNEGFYTEPALQKQAGEQFSSRGMGRFGSTEGDVPVFGSELTPEQRLDIILSGELPNDFS